MALFGGGREGTGSGAVVYRKEGRPITFLLWYWQPPEQWPLNCMKKSQCETHASERLYQRGAGSRLLVRGTGVEMSQLPVRCACHSGIEKTHAVREASLIKGPRVVVGHPKKWWETVVQEHVMGTRS